MDDGGPLKSNFDKTNYNLDCLSNDHSIILYSIHKCLNFKRHFPKLDRTSIKPIGLKTHTHTQTHIELDTAFIFFIQTFKVFLSRCRAE